MTQGVTVVAEIPITALWLDAEGVGQMLGYDARVVRERIACRPDFPKPSRIDHKANPRWLASEVNAWMLKWREETGGRPRAA